MEKNRPRITVTPDGPYELVGEVPITPKRMVLSDLGEPLTWATYEELPHPSPVFLCRCGQSGSKPFCDGSHKTADFDGTETASDKPFFDVAKTYEGPGLTVRRVGKICEHASFCANKTTDWFQSLPDSGDIGTRGQIIGMIEHCPSGALVYEMDGEVLEPNLPLSVSPVEDGPYFLTGGVTVVHINGVEMETRNRVTLCRCGHSANKPLCDGTHAEIGFEAKNPASTPVEIKKGEVEQARGPVKRMVVGAGGSTSPEIYQVAGMVALAGLSEVDVVHVAGDQAADEPVLAGAIDSLEEAGLSRSGIESEQRSGHPGPTLALAAEETGADLIVMGRGGVEVGRTSHRVAYQSPCDVLLVASRGADRSDSYEKVLIATDGSATADRAAKRGYGLARCLGASVDLVFVGHPETGDLIVADTIAVCGGGVETRPWLLQGDPIEQILEAATTTGADLVVVGNKGMTRTRTMIGTSVPGGVVNGATCDVLLCRTVRQMESELEPGEGGVIERRGEQLAAFVDEGGELHLMSARCPHLGCIVAWDPTEKAFECPCHGSQFSPLGELTSGPATKPLRKASDH
ncbi:MAG: CDGSH iron-sulfur domain-containing protein [Actinomycetota bacterium]|nr:CDGSH iron-sulfur domain-containing protein [Actinomycetota bacterium]